MSNNLLMQNHEFRNDEKRIRLLIGHNNMETIIKLIEDIEKIEYVDIIGIAKDGEEVCRKISKLKPEMVFTQYNIGDMNGIDIVKLVKAESQNSVPIFNMIVENEITEKEIDIMYETIGNKLNAMVTKEEILNVLKEYKEYIDSQSNK